MRPFPLSIVGAAFLVDEVTGKVDGFRLAGIVEYRSSSPLADSGN